MIRLDKVSKRFPGSAGFAVQDLNLEVRAGETVVLVGPSGCGKTTTMKMINRLVEPTAGTVYLDGKDIREQDPVVLRRNIGYVIQSVGLLPHRRVSDNIATVPKLLGWSSGRIEARVRQLSTLLELDAELLHRYPRELSGGQQQRVGVARALAADPPVMLMDEPFAAVDPVVRSRLQDQFLEIQQELRKTIVFVTHDIDEAMKMADRIALLNVGGVLEQLASPAEVLSKPAGAFVAGFVGAERGLKRLALMRTADVDLDGTPAVARTATVAEAAAAMDAAGTDWVAVLREQEFVGLVTRGNLARLERRERLPRTWGRVTEQDSLRTALDAAVASRDQLAAVVSETGKLVGVLTPRRIGELLAQPEAP